MTKASPQRIQRRKYPRPMMQDKTAGPQDKYYIYYRQGFSDGWNQLAAKLNEQGLTIPTVEEILNGEK